MITKEQEAEILRLHHVEKWLVGTIAGQLRVHHTTVQRVLRRHGVTSEVVHPRPSIVDPYKAMIVEQLEKYPKLRASRLYEMAKERGYQGSPEHFRKVVARLRPRRSAEAYLRLRTLPGEQAQVDWAHFGKHQVGAATRALWAFVMVLSWSRHMYLRFFWGSAMPVFLRGHVEAFESFAGVPRVLLYDNLKSAVIERRGTPFASTNSYWISPRTIASSPVPLLPRGATRRAEWSGRSATSERTSTKLGSGRTSTT